MKIKLRAENDIQVLSISEIDSSKNVDVLRAGVTQLLKNGKNRIVLELAEAKMVPAEVLRELGRLKLVANELAGDIVISGVDADTKQKIDSFAKPPFAQSFEKTSQAIQFLKELGAPKPKAPAAPATATPAAAAAAAPVHETPIHANAAADPVLKYKEDIRNKEMGELGTIRKELAELKSENQALTALLAQKIWNRREPGDVAAYQEKIRELEKQLADLLSQPAEKRK